MEPATIATVAAVATLLMSECGCVAGKYKLAKKDAATAQILNVDFENSGPPMATLATLIIYGGPGSWKRQALWDEYVVILTNR